MKAEQGQEYRIVYPAPAGRRVGQGALERFRHRFTNADGQTVVLEDTIGDVIYASENVDYPRGPRGQYRHTRWIEAHPKRFELIKD